MDPRAYFSQTLLDAYRSQYREQLELWTSLDQKAQGIATVSAALLAGGLAYSLQAGAEPNGVVLAAGLVGLAISLVMSAIVLRPRRAVSFPGGTFLQDEVGHLMECPEEELEPRRLAFDQGLIAAWKNAVEAQSPVLRRKAVHLWWSQLALIVALGVLVVLTAKTSFFDNVEQENEVHQTQLREHGGPELKLLSKPRAPVGQPFAAEGADGRGHQEEGSGQTTGEQHLEEKKGLAIDFPPPFVGPPREGTP